MLHAELNNRDKGRKNKHSTWFCDLEGLNLKLHFTIIKSLLPWGDTSTRCSIPLQQRYSFHLDMIAQLHVYHPWHWRNVPFSESPHKTLVYKSLAEISPLAKLPSQAVDFQTPYLQSAAQRGPSHWGITRVGEEASAGSGCLAESVSAVTHRSFHSSLQLWHRARISATFKTGEPATASPSHLIKGWRFTHLSFTARGKHQNVIVNPFWHLTFACCGSSWGALERLSSEIPPLFA